MASYKESPAQIQHRKIEGLERLLAFALQEKHETPDSMVTFALETLSTGDSRMVAVASPGLDESSLEDFRSWLKGGLTKMADGQFWRIESHELGAYIIDPSHGRSVVDPGGTALPRLAVLELLMHEDWRVGRCAYPPCGRVFIRKKAGLFCSLRCSQITRQIRRFDPKRARKLEALNAPPEPAPPTLRKQLLDAERLFLAECPLGLDPIQHQDEGLEHRMAPSGRVLCLPQSAGRDKYPPTRGQTELTEKKRAVKEQQVAGQREMLKKLKK